MPGWHSILLFMGAALALNFTPGPDMLYIAARSTAEGRRAGIASAIGISVGCLFHLSALALGLSALLRAVPAAYDFIRIGGAAYLIFLGIRAIARPQGLAMAGVSADSSLWRIFRQGVLTNVLNPKVALFFLAFLPQFVDPARGSAAAQIVVLGLLFNVSGTLVNLGVALGASRATEWLRVRERSARAVQRATGVIFVALGIRLAFATRR